MRWCLAAAVLLAALLLGSEPSLAQTPVTIVGPVTVGNCVSFFSPVQVQDAGTACGGTSITFPLSLAQGGTNNSLTASNGGIVWSDASKLNILAGTVTSGQCLLSGSSAAPSWGSCSGAAAVSSVTNANGTLTISPTTGAVVASLNTGHANTWTAAQTFTNSDILLLGSSTGATTFASANAGASNFTITFPAATGTVALTTNANVASVSNADGTLTISPTTGAVVASIALGHANTWTALQKYILSGTGLLVSNNAAATALTNQGIDVAQDGAPGSITITTYGIVGATNMPTFVGQAARGSLASPAVVQANDVLASFSGRGYIGSGFAAAGRGFVRMFASELWSSVANGTYISFATTASGTTTTAEALRIEASGGLTVPTTVTGGDKGAGSINVGSLFIAGTAVTLPISLANGGTNNGLTASAGGIVWSDASKLNILAGTSTSGQCLLSGNLVTPSWGTCPQSVASVSNADGTLTISPTTGSVVASINLAHANTWSATQTFSGTLNVSGTFQIGGTTVTLPISLANGGTAAALAASNGGIVYSTASAFAILAGTVTSGQCLLSGSSAAPTWGSCSGGAAVSSVSNADGTLTISPTTGAVVASIALGHVNTWSGAQSFNSTKLILNGSSSGATTLNAAATAGATTATLPNNTGTIAELNFAQTWTAAQTFTNSDILLLGSSTGATTFASANAGASNFTITFPAATDQLVARATTDTLTNKTYDTAGTGNVFKINGTTITAISGNTGTVGSTSGAFVSGNCVKTDASHNLVDNGTTCGGGGGTPGGANTNVQFNSSSTFGGDSSFTYAGAGAGVTIVGAAGSTALTLTGGTQTASHPALAITQTWNNAAANFDAFTINATRTAQLISTLADFIVDGSPVAAVFGRNLTLGSGTIVSSNGFVAGVSGPADRASAGSIDMGAYTGAISMASSIFLGWNSSGSAEATADVVVNRGGTGKLVLSDSTTATGFFAYNTVDTATGPTNYERGVFDWTTTANILTVGTQKGGTGTARPMLLAPAQLFAASGPAIPACAAGLKGYEGVVSDATAPTYNATYASGGSVVAHVVCDGANWKTQ